MSAQGLNGLNGRGFTRRATISDVAERAGTTKSTVSRALNGYPDISSHTRARVERVAAELGYSPLSQAQSIRTGRVRSLGFVLQTYDHDSHRPFLAGFLAGISRSANAQGWDLTLTTAESQQATLDVLRRLAVERKADGFILSRPERNDPRVSLLLSENIPFVLFGRTNDPTGCSWYDILGEEAMKEAVVRLHGHGHRRIGFVNGGEHFSYSTFRLQGYLEGLKECGLEFDANLVANNAATTEQGRRAALDLLRLELPPTAIVYAVDMAALGLYRAAEEIGLEIGRDISVIAYDGIPEGLFAHPPLTTFSVDRVRAGERLATQLINRICGAESDSQRETERAVLLKRNSDRPPIRSSEEFAVCLSRTAQLQLSEKKEID
ncbi:MAG: substrate-binding domain-containing protein [Rhodobacteraceae bacterium]|nr:substrate-binding domain-containing protein [Paracoccaceae bacterium]